MHILNACESIFYRLQWSVYFIHTHACTFVYIHSVKTSRFASRRIAVIRNENLNSAFKNGWQKKKKKEKKMCSAHSKCVRHRNTRVYCEIIIAPYGPTTTSISRNRDRQVDRFNSLFVFKFHRGRCRRRRRNQRSCFFFFVHFGCCCRQQVNRIDQYKFVWVTTAPKIPVQTERQKKKEKKTHTTHAHTFSSDRNCKGTKEKDKANAS